MMVERAALLPQHARLRLSLSLVYQRFTVARLTCVMLITLDGDAAADLIAVTCVASADASAACAAAFCVASAEMDASDAVACAAAASDWFAFPMIVSSLARIACRRV
jgi:hypothetical protein